jgi:hypothetical protein
MKHVRRLIVTSATYGQASRPASSADAVWRAAMERDPKNYRWSRYPRRRLQGETLRDMMLAVSGSLNRVQNGESVRPPLPKEVVQTLLRSDHWKVSEDESDHYRRSIYVFARRNLRYPIFEVFDRPAATASCAARSRSTIAPQSLMLLNSEFSLDAARRLASSVLREADDDPDRSIRRIFRRTLGRSPTDEELADTRAFFAARLSRERAGDIADATLPLPAQDHSDQRHAAAMVDFCVAMLNCSEFVYLE